MKTEIVPILTEESIKNKIFIIRNQKVMLDFHLAEIYGYETKYFNRQVQRNIEKFDNDFMFRLTTDEFNELSRCQNVTSIQTKGVKGGRAYLPYAFTESGIYMLMTVLKGELATQQSKMLIRLFKQMKDYIVAGNNYVTYDEFTKHLLCTEDSIKEIKNDIKKNYISKKEFTKVINELTDNKIKKDYLFLNGEKIEASIVYQDIYNNAKKTIHILDDYINLKTLILLKGIKKNVKVIIFSDNVNHSLSKEEFEDFKKEYNLDITIKVTNKMYHDRYIFIDYDTKNEIIYHSGSSSKDAGNKVTTINMVNDNNVYHSIIESLKGNEELVL